MTFLTGTLLLAVVTALACALPGTFVVLRRESMLVDAIAHAVLPGIIVGYFFTRNLDSPWLILGAAAAGLVVMLGSQWLSDSGLIAGDAPQGLVFPALFSVGVIMVTLNFANVHLDTDAVLVGDLNLAAFWHLTVCVTSIGPPYLYVMLAVLALNIAFLAAFHRQLTAATFDGPFATILGIPVKTVNTAFMFLVSVTVTAAFNAAGAILVIALVVVPAATAHLLTTRLSTMFAVTAAIAVAGGIAGFWIAYAVNAATSAAMSVSYGAIFVVTHLGTRLLRSRRRAAVADGSANDESVASRTAAASDGAAATRGA